MNRLIRPANPAKHPSTFDVVHEDVDPPHFNARNKHTIPAINRKAPAKSIFFSFSLQLRFKPCCFGSLSLMIITENASAPNASCCQLWHADRLDQIELAKIQPETKPPRQPARIREHPSQSGTGDRSDPIHAHNDRHVQRALLQWHQMSSDGQTSRQYTRRSDARNCPTRDENRGAERRRADGGPQFENYKCS